MNRQLYIKFIKPILFVALTIGAQVVSAQCTTPTSTIINNANCATGSGTINFTGPTPVGNYQFSIDGGATFGATGQTSFTGLFGGTYPTVSKLVATGCVSSVTNKTLTNPASPANPTSTVVNVSNCNTPNGSITFTGPTPLTSYQFSIDGGLTFGAPGVVSFPGLSAGSYITVAKNATTNCVSGNTSKTIANPVIAAPVSTTGAANNCNTPNGSITFTAQTGFVFSIDGGATFGTTGQTLFNGLNAGTYVTLSMQTSTGCRSATSSKTVAGPTITAPTSTVVNASNCNVPNGSITFTAPTPVASYQFSIDGGTTFGTAGQTLFPGLAPATYVTVSRLVSTGCVSARVNKTVAKPTITTPTSTVVNVSNCNTPNGSITFTAPTPLANYRFSVDGGATFGTAGQVLFNGRPAGTYSTVAMLNSSGCTSSPVSKVIANPTVTAPTSALTTSSCTTPTGSITFSAPTPTANFSFSVNGGTTFGTAGQTSFTGLAAGTYATRTRSAVGCLSAITNRTITNTVTAAPTATITASNACNPYNGIITFTGPTPVASYQFSIDGGATYGTTGQSVFTGLTPNVYLTRARSNTTGCISAVVNQTVTSANGILTTTPGFTQTNVTNCATPNGSITFTSPTPVSSYQFSIDGGLTYGTTGTATFSGLQAGTYQLVVRNPANECASLSNTANILKPVRAGADQAICLLQTTLMTANAVSGAAWTALPGNPATTVFANAALATTRVSGFTTTGTYNYIWSGPSCSDTVSIEVADCLSPIGCTNSGYLFQSNSGSPTDILTVDLGTGAQTLLYTDITTLPENINGIGFNITDGHVWGSVVNGTGATIGASKIARIGADGIPVFFDINGLYNGGYNVGAIDNDGLLYLYSSSQTQIFRVDVNPSSPTYLTLRAPILTTTAMNIADWGFNPIDGFFYGVDNTNRALYRVNPTTGASITVGTVSGNANFNAGTFGACYFDAQGNLYVGDNTLGGVYKINTVHNVSGNTTAALRSQGQPASGNDGAMCQFACIKPDAGRDTLVCISTAPAMSATQVSGIEWFAQADNPGTAVISNPNNANTTISGFSTKGVYHFIWTNGGGCNDTATITVYNCITDTVYVPCDTCVTVVCNPFNVDLPVTDTTTFGTCGLSTTDAAFGTLTVDENGCAIWTPNGTQSAADTVTTCITSCNGPVCDTTFIIIIPPPVILPVNLAYFTAKDYSKCQTSLSWQTTQETNSKSFTIERGTLSNKWVEIATIPASGKSNSPLAYSYIDAHASSGKNLYRLKMTNLNESYNYSHIVTVTSDCIRASVSIFPNPANVQTGFQMQANTSEEVAYQIFDATGRLLLTGNFTGMQEITVLKAGMYIVKVNSASVNSTQKIMIR